MRLFQLTSKNFTGYTTLLYDNFEKLVAVSFEKADLGVSQTNGLLRYLPVEVASMEAFLKDYPHLKIVEGSFHITWEKFWDEYGKKVNAIRARPLWDRLVAGDMVGAFYGIAPYKAFCKAEGRKIADPETYLRYRYWENQY